MEPECVEAFYAALEKTESKFDLYRFNTLEINAQGKVIKLYPPHPPVESVIEFAYHRLNRNRESFISEYIFARKAFDANGGMVKFPLAWCSDDASWITFAEDQGIYTIDGPKIYWRNSNVNISFAAPDTPRGQTRSLRPLSGMAESEIHFRSHKQRFKHRFTDLP